MFRDREQELERLSQELWEDSEEELTEEEAPEEDEDLLSEDELNQLLDIDVHNADRSDVDLDELTEELDKAEKPRRIGALVAFMVLLTGIALFLCWKILQHLGVIG